MSSPIRLVFRVKDIPEEYAIVSRMLCPLCEYPLAREMQTMFEDKDNNIRGDLQKLRCTNKTCGTQLEVFFHLPEDYDPLSMWKK
jgi:hypothetical protein